MRWEERLHGVVDDLEQQAEGLFLAERDALVAEQRRGEYAQVDLEGRLHASLGCLLTAQVLGTDPVTGVLVRAGSGWFLLEADHREWIVRLAAVTLVRGLLDRATTAEARPVGARLGIGSALRGVAEGGTETVLHRVDGSTSRGFLGRVGQDFLELGAGMDPERGGTLDVVPFAALAAVRSD
jgi:hypothetical protein